MDFVLGIDLGSSYFKLGLFDRDGELRGLGRVPVEANTGDGSRCELPADRYWSTLSEGVRIALDQAGAAPERIRAVAYSSQANSFLLLDESGEALTSLILWQDVRSNGADAALESLGRREDFLRVTGLGLDFEPGFAVAKMRWLQDNRPECWSRARRVMTISDYLVFSLTGRAAGDQGTASLLGLLDLPNGRWWDEALGAAGLRAALLSEPLRPGAVVGTVTPEGSQRIGIPDGIPLAVGSLDHHMAAIGAGVGQVAQFSESTGTVLACLYCTDEYQPMREVCIGPGLVGSSTYYKFAFDSNGASVLDWYRRTHAPDRSVRELDALAEEIPIGCDGLVALPLANEFPSFEGFRNRRDSHHHGHFARAIMESTAATMASFVDRLCEHGRCERIVATGGGARSDVWLQIKADLIGVEFVRPKCQEPACLGAAMVAAMAAGWFPDFQSVSASWTKTDRVFRPEPANQDRYAAWYEQYRGLTA